VGVREEGRNAARTTREVHDARTRHRPVLAATHVCADEILPVTVGAPPEDFVLRGANSTFKDAPASTLVRLTDQVQSRRSA
jgi:hypothetical protein